MARRTTSCRCPWPSRFSTAANACPQPTQNFLIVNGAVLKPTYGSPRDAEAAAQLRRAFPDREVVGITLLTAYQATRFAPLRDDAVSGGFSSMKIGFVQQSNTADVAAKRRTPQNAVRACARQGAELVVLQEFAQRALLLPD
jgi:hypothetical protein